MDDVASLLLKLKATSPLNPRKNQDLNEQILGKILDKISAFLIALRYGKVPIELSVMHNDDSNCIHLYSRILKQHHWVRKFLRELCKADSGFGCFYINN